MNDQHSILTSAYPQPVLFEGDAVEKLKTIASGSIDCVVTSPPYWGHRQYNEDGIGLETRIEDYILALEQVMQEVHRVLKPTGSVWLNIGDTYKDKGLVGVPWRVALHLIDTQGWMIRNDVIWHKVKGGLDNSRDKLRNLHEHVFHLVKAKKYYYNDEAVRRPPRKALSTGENPVSATGVSGRRYRRQIELSTVLEPSEKHRALAALDTILDDVRAGRVSDFRMIIRGQQRTTHSDSDRVSGRAKELQNRGFYFLRYHPKGSKLSDVWEILPEDSQGRNKMHYAAFPEELCRLPIAATCPPDGIVLDPFCGTGTTLLAASRAGRRSIGIDISPAYIALTEQRIRTEL